MTTKALSVSQLSTRNCTTSLVRSAIDCTEEVPALAKLKFEVDVTDPMGSIEAKVFPERAEPLSDITGAEVFGNASEVAEDVATSKSLLPLTPNTPNKKSKTECYKTESSSTQEKIANPAAKNSMDNMSDDETDAEDA